MRTLGVEQRATVGRADQRAWDRRRVAYHRVEHVSVIDHMQLVAGDPVTARQRNRLGLLDWPVRIFRIGIRLWFVIPFLVTFLRLNLNVLRVLAAEIHQTVVVEDRLAEIPAVGVFLFAVLVLLNREVDRRGQAWLGRVGNVEAKQLPGAPAIVARHPDIPLHQAAINIRSTTPAPVAVAASVGPQQLAGAWPVALELVAPTHVFVHQRQLTDHGQFRQLSQVDHRQEHVWLRLFRLRFLFVPIAIAVIILRFLRLRHGFSSLVGLCLQ